MRLALALALAATAAAAAAEPARPLPGYDRLFDATDRWAGADGVYTVRLARDRLLWLFGDTFRGAVRGGRRYDAVMVNNTAAVQEGLAAADARVDFFFGAKPDGAPDALLRPPEADRWYWPLGAERVGDALLLFQGVIEPTGEHSAFGFRRVGTDLLVVEDADLPPDRWRPRRVAIPFGRQDAGGDARWFGTATLQDRGYLYVYGIRDRVVDGAGRRTLVVARVPRRAAADLALWRFYDGSGWVRDPARCADLLEEAAPEMTVDPRPGGGFVAVYTPNGFSREIRLADAPGPTGPFRSPRVVFRCPEAARDPDLFCYAAKGHPDLPAGPGELVVTYVVNSNDFFKVAGDAALYRPRFLAAPLR